MTESDLYNMSDEELDAAFEAAKSDVESPEVEYEDEGAEEVVEEETTEEDEVEEEVEEDLEQPTSEDSDDDASTDSEVEEETEEDSGDGEGELDGEPETEEEQTDEVETKAETEVQPIQKQSFKANGREYEFTDKEILEQFPKIFGQAMDYTKKMQNIKPWRKTIDAIEGAKLNHDDVNLMIDVLKGDKDAINEVIKRTGVDALDLDTENSKYSPKDYGRDETELAIKDIVDEISVDKEFDTTQRILSREWDENSWNEMTKDPQLIKLLHMDVKSGMYDKVQAIADTLKVQGKRGTDLDLYKEAASVYYGKQAQEEARLAEAEKAKADREAALADKVRIAEVKAKENKVKTVKQESVKRKAAAPTKRGAGTTKSTNYLDDSDEAFEEWYKKLQGDL